MVPLRSQGFCGVGRGHSGHHWVWYNARGPHLVLRKEPQGSSPFQDGQRAVSPRGDQLHNFPGFVTRSSLFKHHKVFQDNPAFDQVWGPPGHSKCPQAKSRNAWFSFHFLDVEGGLLELIPREALPVDRKSVV